MGGATFTANRIRQNVSAPHLLPASLSGRMVWKQERVRRTWESSSVRREIERLCVAAVDKCDLQLLMRLISDRRHLRSTVHRTEKSQWTKMS